MFKEKLSGQSWQEGEGNEVKVWGWRMADQVQHRGHNIYGFYLESFSHNKDFSF